MDRASTQTKRGVDLNTFHPLSNQGNEIITRRSWDGPVDIAKEVFLLVCYQAVGALSTLM